MAFEDAKQRRENRMNPPEFAPSQDTGFDLDFDLQNDSTMPSGSAFDVFGDSSGGGFDNFGGGGFGGPQMGGPQMGGGFDGFGGQQMGGFGGPQMNGGYNGTFPNQNQAPQKSTEDMVFDGLIAGGKGVFNTFKECTEILNKSTPLFKQRWGYRAFWTGIAFVVVGLISRLMFNWGFKVAIGGLLGTMFGVVMWMFNTSAAQDCQIEFLDDTNDGAFNMFEDNGADDFNNTGFEDNGFDDMSFDTNTFDDDTSAIDSGSDWDDWGNDTDDSEIETDEEDDWGKFSTDDSKESDIPQAVDKEEALNSMQDVPQGMYTRQYLYEMFTKVLPNVLPTFNTFVEVSDSEDEFYEWETYIREAAEVTGCKEENLPELLDLQYNSFIYLLTFTRTPGLKSEAIASEIVNIYVNRSGRVPPENRDKCYSTVETIGKQCKVTLFKGTTAMVSLKDMMQKESEFVLNTKNYMPVILGIDQLGNVIKCDFKKLETLIVAGMPRSGKSWFVQAVLTQMCAFVSPSEMNIYICDPKDGISDFKSFQLPHVKRFVTGDDSIVKALRDIVKKEAPRRKKILGDANCQNIWDFKEKRPDVKLPIIYFCIDEVVTLAERMEKETKKEFQGLLVELISQLPALGIRAFLIPHVVKNDIIAKTATDLVPCKISVFGDAEHIEQTTGAKPKDFPYKLAYTGDMAARITLISPTAFYLHGPVLTTSNPENIELFEYMRRVWGKLEPDELKDSVGANTDIDMANKKVLDELEASKDSFNWDL